MERVSSNIKSGNDACRVDTSPLVSEKWTTDRKASSAVMTRCSSFIPVIAAIVSMPTGSCTHTAVHNTRRRSLTSLSSTSSHFVGSEAEFVVCLHKYFNEMMIVSLGAHEQESTVFANTYRAVRSTNIQRLKNLLGQLIITPLFGLGYFICIISLCRSFRGTGTNKVGKLSSE